MDEPIHEVERSLLRLLCLETTVSQLREEMLARLRGYAFRSVEHQVLFDCLQAMPMDRPELLRELLPARLVRAGFPDFDLAPFFESSRESARKLHGLDAQQARSLVEELLATKSTREAGM